MNLELNLRFPRPDCLIVSLEDNATGTLAFTSPFTAQDRKEIQWYLETYAGHYTTDVDDTEAARIEAKLPIWGATLFNAALNDRQAARLFNRFQDKEEEGRLLTIAAEHPSVLSLPWELLRDPNGVYLFNENPRISVRRRIAGATGGRSSFRPETKRWLRLLFVISRPDNVGFIDPRSDPQAVMDALEKYAPGRVTVEFLRPATFDHLIERLEDRYLPVVDVLHFDGHGFFDAGGGEILLSRPAGELMRRAGAETRANIGYILFEKKGGNADYVSAQLLGEMLQRHRVGLVVLSACQSAALGENEEPMGSVAARLNATGVPAVLAMTYSVLITTTRLLFGEFYKHLARGAGVGEALDNARRFLMRHPEKHEVQRGPQRVQLKLHDWFLPTLYQAGDDVPLLERDPVVSPDTSAALGVLDNLPKLQEAGFFGRQRELLEIERWFVGDTRRITVTGFGGQGKTYLAVEAGRWLALTGMFDRIVFVDYAGFQGIDAVEHAIVMFATVFKESFPNAEAVAAVLRETRTLVILDNLEALEKPSGDMHEAAVKIEPTHSSLQKLLDVAKDWSECGRCRVLITSRTLAWQHPAYQLQGTKIHRVLALKGLEPEDALCFFQSLLNVPPTPTVPHLPDREAVIRLFELVDFHPLSIALLGQQLKIRRPAELGDRLEMLLIEARGDKNRNLVASLKLSLDKLDVQAREWLPRLGVFQGGAFEENLLAITRIPPDRWSALREKLQSASLINVESLKIAEPYVRLHPTLAPLVWSELSLIDRQEISEVYRQQYYEVSRELYDALHRGQMSEIDLRELPNLLHAVNAALDAGEEFAMEFANNVNQLLCFFGLGRSAAALRERINLQQFERGSHSWYLALSNKADRLLKEGQSADARAALEELQNGLGTTPTYERCTTLSRLGRCFEEEGRFDLAQRAYQEVLGQVDRLQPTDNLRRIHAACLIDLGNVLAADKRYAAARRSYEAALSMTDDLESQVIIEGQLGALHTAEGQLEEAVQRCMNAYRLSKDLRRPEIEAGCLHHLGEVCEQATLWDHAEQCYRESAEINEKHGNYSDLAKTWHQLGNICAQTGKFEAAEDWYRKVKRHLRSDLK
jgi:tetratricopeptide (TPR) repeat protein